MVTFGMKMVTFGRWSQRYVDCVHFWQVVAALEGGAEVLAGDPKDGNMWSAIIHLTAGVCAGSGDLELGLGLELWFGIWRLGVGAWDLEMGGWD